MREKRLVIISVDALVWEDIAYLSDMPSFSYILKNGSVVERIRSIYPTLTYPCHTTMSTGCYPDKHGIMNNTFDIPMKSPPWIFERKYVKCKDILDAAKEAGYTTAAVGWPITGWHKSVDYLVNECWPTPDGDAEEYKRAYLESGTPEELFQEVVAPYIHLRVGRKQPESSYFLAHVAADILKKHKPNLLMLHFGVVDKYRHVTGVFSEKVNEGLRQSEEILAMLFAAAKEAGIFDEINWVVTSDHGQLNYSKTVYLNSLLRDKGFIDTDGDTVTGMRAYAFASGMSAQVHVEDGSRDAVYELLREAMESGLFGISKIYTKAEAAEEHAAGSFEFMLETDGGTAFKNDVVGPYARPAREVLTGLAEGSHGFHPDKGPRPTLLAAGPDIRRGVTLKEGRLIDGAPTYAEILGVSLPDADGTPLYEIIGE